jgi:hypothetical protein
VNDLVLTWQSFLWHIESTWQLNFKVRQVSKTNSEEVVAKVEVVDEKNY